MIRVFRDELAEKIKERVVRIISEQLMMKPEEITLESDFVEDLGADSLDVVELVIIFEDEFGIKIPDKDAEKVNTVKEAIDYITRKVKEKSKES